MQTTTKPDTPLKLTGKVPVEVEVLPREIGRTLLHLANERCGAGDDAGCDYFTDQNGHSFIARRDWRISTSPVIAALIDAGNVLVSGYVLKLDDDPTPMPDTDLAAALYVDVANMTPDTGDEVRHGIVKNVLLTLEARGLVAGESVGGALEVWSRRTAVVLPRAALDRAVRALGRPGKIEALALIRAAFDCSLDDAKPIFDAVLNS